MKKGENMPIGGFIVSVNPDHLENSIESLKEIAGLEIYGSDEKGNVVVVLEADTSKAMEEMVEKIMEIENVFSVGLTYFNVEDEVEVKEAQGKKTIH